MKCSLQPILSQIKCFGSYHWGMATNQLEETLEYDDFLHWTVSSLKDFLALRGLKQSGLKAELIARAFGAYELNVPKKFTQEQIYDPGRVREKVGIKRHRNGPKRATR